MQRHPFYAGPHITHDGQPICEGCGGIRRDKVHAVPEVSAEARVIDARKVGENPEV